MAESVRPGVREMLPILLGAALFPVAVAASLAALGYHLDGVLEALRGAAFPGPAAVLVLSLAVAGGVLGAAVQRRHLVVATGIVGYVVLTVRDPVFGPGPAGYTGVTAFAADALFLAVLSVLALAWAWMRAHPSAVRAYATPTALRAGVIVGLAHLVLVVVLRDQLFGLSWGSRSLVAFGLLAWMLAGAFLEGAVPGFLAVRERLAAPALVVGTCFAWAVYDTWQLVRPLRRGGPALAAAITPITLYLVAWFAVLALAIGAGVTERAFRRAPDDRESPDSP